MRPSLRAAVGYLYGCGGDAWAMSGADASAETGGMEAPLTAEGGGCVRCGRCIVVLVGEGGVDAA